MLGFVCLFICCCCFKYLDTAVETVTLNSWDTDLQHLRCPAVCATSCEGFVETSWYLWVLKKNRVSESLWYMAASSPAALLSFHSFAQGPWCPWCMGSQWWQHLPILSLVLGMNPEELSSHPFPAITSISLSSLFHGDSGLISPPGWFFADVPAVAFRLPADDIPPRACAGLMRADSWWGGGSRAAALFAGVTNCLGACRRRANPRELIAASWACWRDCLPWASVPLC